MAAVSFSACSDKSSDTAETIEEIKPEPRPNWQTPTNLHYSSMTVLLDEQALPADVEISEDDLLGAFVGDQCRGFIEPIKDVDGRYRFYLLVNATTDDVNNKNMKVELRYYSAQKARIYTAQPFAFEYDGRLGTISKSYVPNWK